MNTRRNRRNRTGFTIVEMIIVIGAIALLVGLLSVGLQSAIRSGRKTTELNNIRQTIVAWTAYANSYEGWVMPGYLDEDTQEHWNVKFRDIKGDTLPAEVCRYYPHRLLPYLDYQLEPILGYRDENLNELAVDTVLVAEEPAFGYNGYYVGGWWTKTQNDPLPRMQFMDHSWNTQPDNSGSTAQGRLVAQTIPSINNPSSMVIFSASCRLAAGRYASNSELLPGASWVVPPKLGNFDIWEPGTGPLRGMGASVYPISATGLAMDVLIEQAVPLRRYGLQVATAHADGSTRAAGIGELYDQRKWINPAHSKDFTHQPTSAP
ncbi:MAG: hypothetical protein CMJ32_09375 [Phycisphaerae bacterium]|nr:hypothetical protein [Phycisphaerae bacterium]